MMGVLVLFSVFLLIAAVTPQGNSEAATFVTSARAPDIVFQAFQAMVVAALITLVIAVTLALLKERSTLAARARSGLRLSTMNFLSRTHYTASGDADVGHRQPRRTFGQIVDDLFSGLGSLAFKTGVPFRC